MGSSENDRIVAGTPEIAVRKTTVSIFYLKLVFVQHFMVKFFLQGLRRSTRNVQRKTYKDDLDIHLSGDEEGKKAEEQPQGTEQRQDGVAVPPSIEDDTPLHASYFLVCSCWCIDQTFLTACCVRLLLMRLRRMLLRKY